MFRHSVSTLATHRFACSSVAGKWMFDKDFKIIYNAIDKARFSYDELWRKNTREALGLPMKMVFIHIVIHVMQK